MVDKSQKNEKADSGKPATKRHPKFYFDNTLMVLQVEDTLFNVHKYQLMKSKVFADMFEIANRDPDEGSCPENPISLEEVSASDFECLLTVLYATHFSTSQPAPDAGLIIPAFRLANQWNFEDLRAYLLPLAEKKLGDVDKIVFGRLFDIKAWLAPAHINLCTRKDPVTDEEAGKLGTSSLALISRLREEARRQSPVGTKTCCSCAGYTHNDGADDHKCQKCGKNSHVLTRGSDQPPNRDAIAPKVERWVDEGGASSE